MTLIYHLKKKKENIGTQMGFNIPLNILRNLRGKYFKNTGY